MTDEEKYPVYFIMQDERPDGNSFMKVSYEISKLGFCDDKFQRIMIMTMEQKISFFGWISNSMGYFIPKGDANLWEFAGFRIKTLKGVIE